ncbi:MAG: alpha-galactosidase, partial [Treponema sp.]|nr:alpha-galactosidase [Treponema sp.]
MRERKTVYIAPKRDGVGAMKVREQAADYFHDIDILAGFPETPPGTMARSLVKCPGLSVNFAHNRGNAAMKSLQVVSDNSAAGSLARQAALENPDNGLRLEIDYTYYPEHNAVLIGGCAVNTSAVPIRHLADLCSFDIAFDAAWTGDTILYTIGGGTTHYVFPPFAFQIDKRRVMGSLWASFSIESSQTGRSADHHMPFFYITDEDDGSGVYGALEWSGSWKIDFHRREEYLYVKGGITEVDLTLRPGERISIPRALLGFWEGDIAAGRNALRRFIRSWYPKWQGEDLGAPVTWNHAFTFGPSINDEIFRRQVPVCADLGFEWMQIDWGWFAGCAPHKNAGGDASSGIGNWDRVDTERFPGGIEPLADLVRSYGMKYCTWIDPEQVSSTSDFAYEHPEWVLYNVDSGGQR